jgi:hypothetical protein
MLPRTTLVRIKVTRIVLGETMLMGMARIKWVYNKHSTE